MLWCYEKKCLVTLHYFTGNFEKRIQNNTGNTISTCIFVNCIKLKSIYKIVNNVIADTF